MWLFSFKYLRSRVVSHFKRENNIFLTTTKMIANDTLAQKQQTNETTETQALILDALKFSDISGYFDETEKGEFFFYIRSLFSCNNANHQLESPIALYCLALIAGYLEIGNNRSDIHSSVALIVCYGDADANISAVTEKGTVEIFVHEDPIFQLSSSALTSEKVCLFCNWWFK